MKPATEPPPPDEVSSSDELFLIGQHLEQYRHATRHPADYWEEALKRDPGDLRCNNGLGLWRLRRGEFETARDHFQVAIDRATSRNPNPRDGEPFYNLGLALRFLGQDKEAEDAFAKSAWNAAWQAAAYHALAELTCRKGDWQQALGYLDRSLRQDQDNFRAANLRTIVHRKLGRVDGVSDQLKADPLDYWGCHLAGRPIPISNSVRLDIAIDLLRAGLFAEAAEILEPADLAVSDGTVPMVWYYRAYVLSCLGQDPAETYRNASAANPDYCFPSRLEDIDILSAAPRSDARAPFYLGNLLYDRRRYAEAIEQWGRAVALEPGNSVALRNLGIAAFNVQHDPVRAQAFYDRAISAAPEDDRLWYERDQLHKRIGDESAQRLRTLEARRDLVAKRDDLTIEFCSLLDAAGRAEEAAAILEGRRFQPWEGGESMALGIYTRVQLSRAKSNPDRAVEFLAMAIHLPSNLGEARHLLANASDLWLAYGDALTAAGHPDEAWRWWSKAADFQGDFQEMAVQPFSELTCYQALAMIRLGRAGEAENLLLKLRDYADQLAKAEAKIDYFATSLPTMLLFEDDLQARQNAQARRLYEQAELGLSTLAHGLSS
jgi:tetratricopeptide (TPR) repeat protein